MRKALEGKSTPEILANDGRGAPRVREKGSRQAANPYHKRTPVPGISPLGPEQASSSASPAPESVAIPEQTTLQDSWGQTKITAPRQATIDYFLLRMVICCALAFSLLDNGFFIDFCIAMYVHIIAPCR